MQSFWNKRLKAFFICCCMLIFMGMGAQTVSTAYQTQINSTFAGVDKTKIPHQLLVDYAMEFAELSAYSGTLTSDNLTHRGHLTAIYHTLLMARVNTNVTGLVSPDTYRTNWDNLRQPDKIALSGLYYKYSQFKSNAYPNYITVINDKLYDKYVNGVWQNPYEDKEVFAMATPILVYQGLNVDVELPNTLWYTNQAGNVQSIAIDFGDGNGYQAMTLGQVKSISYTQSGVYEWKYKLTLTNSQVLYSHSKIQVEGTYTSPPPGAKEVKTAKRLPSEPCSGNIVNGIDEVEFAGTRTYLGQANSATLEIDYSGTNCVIDKPLIVVEGFDSGLMGVENPLGESRYATFRTEADFFTGNLPTQLNTYDIIYVNWDDGNDYLQRNAALLKDIIEWVNTEKTGNTPNVVLGQSMGGLIARYALADMEQTPGEDHDTSLYISHDAPHRGANIPLGIQYFARHMADQFVSTPLGDYEIDTGTGSPVSIEDIKDLLDAPGTKQLLANTVNSNFVIVTTEFDSWQTDLQSKGYPQQTRNVAISNGSHCADLQAFSPGYELFSMNGNGKTSLLTNFLMQLFKPITNLGFLYLAIAFNEPGLLIGVLPGNSKFNLDFKANALPEYGQNAQIYKGKITFTKKLFWFINITVNLTDRSYNNPVGILPYDTYPGGFYDVFLNFSGTSIDNVLGNLNINTNIANSFNFIPSPSALDIGGNFNIQLSEYEHLYKYSVNKLIGFPFDPPFDNFTTSFPNSGAGNEEHISFNTRNGNWLAEELDGDSQANDFDCIYVCESGDIVGAEGICSGSETYTLSVGSGTYNWTVTQEPFFGQSGNLVTVSGNGTSNLTLTRTGPLSGTVTISITPTGICGTAPAAITKTISVGTTLPVVVSADPDPNKIYAQWDECLLYFADITGDLQLNSSNFEFAFSPYNDFDYDGPYGDAVPTWCIAQAPFLNLEFSARLKNDCGWGDWYLFTYLLQGYDPNYPGGFQFMMSTAAPEADLTLEIIEGESAASEESAKASATSRKIASASKDQKYTEDTYNIEVVDVYGRIKYQKKGIQDKKIHINKARWALGIYYIKVSNSKGEFKSRGIAIE
ncbi:hypothetical protein [Seonamhaeicola sp.]|uniref:hypothetical protein n=1 Tax=Seonamhaeicola sp. TaxID=1912245 RepID=UPI00261851BB|nr:hypothetical protein [Seonamhaeicola sp.]